jgi:UDP-glucose 4-epimerase
MALKNENGECVVLLTGANGFVGRNIAPVLTANGLTIRRATRTPSNSANEVVIGAIGPQTNWSEALSNVDAVVHLAGLAHQSSEASEIERYRSVNTDGTVHLACCAAKAGVRHFIYLSTVLVNGDSTDGRAPFCEDDPPSPRGAYGLSKAAAELGLRTLVDNTKMNITVIRPPLIYGAEAVGNFKLLVTAITHGIPLPFGLIRNQRAFLGVGNLASFIIHRLTHSAGGFEVFLVADDGPISTPEFVREIAQALRRNARIVPVPLFAVKASLWIGGQPEAFNSVAGSLVMNISKSRSTGWHPQITLSEGLRISVGSQSHS